MTESNPEPDVGQVSRLLLAQARTEAATGDPAAAAAKAWEAVTKMIKAAAAVRGWECETTEQMMEAVTKLSDEIDDPNLVRLFMSAYGFYQAFHGNDDPSPA